MSAKRINLYTNLLSIYIKSGNINLKFSPIIIEIFTYEMACKSDDIF